jgi:hypothetical protein
MEFDERFKALSQEIRALIFARADFPRPDEDGHG